jgi:Ni/Co efflux regulator RcnB
MLYPAAEGAANRALGAWNRAIERGRRTPVWPGPRTLVVALWTLAALFAGAQRLVERVVLGREADGLLLRQDLWLLGMWALATPAIIWSARRYPVRGSAAVRHAALHFAAGTAFVVVTNVLIRLPLLLPPAALGADGVARDTLLGLARFYPAALIVYGVLLALGHRAWGSAHGSAHGSENGSAHVASADDLACGHLPDAEAMNVNGAAVDRAHADGTNAASPDADRADAEQATAAAHGARPARVVVREWNRVHLVRPDDIEWIEADDNYVVVHAGGRTYKGRGRIGDLETQLDPSCFVRVHRSAIVRTARIREVQPLTKGDLALVLHDGKVLRVSRARRAALEAVLGVPL